MPIMDGWQATKILKNMMDKNEILNIPIIGLTAFTSRNDIEKCI